MELTPGESIERYFVEAEIGRGGMAVVYRVRHARLGSQHALKLLSLTSRSLQERLIQEGRVQATLRHPNVVSVNDVLDVQGQAGLIMELVDGPTLEDWLVDNKPDFDQAEDLFRGILSAVEAAHDKGLVHRDLKPANVLLAPYSGGLMPKVTDFGLAKALAESASGPGTRSGVSMGTPKYMAPEQIRDAAGVDRRADLFSLGCMLYELLLHRPPFDGPDVLSVFNKVATGSFVPLPDDVPDALARAVNGCLVVDPRARIPDCATLRAVLDGASFDGDHGAAASPGATLLPGSFDGGSSETWSPELHQAQGADGLAAAVAPTVPPKAHEAPTLEPNVTPNETLVPSSTAVSDAGGSTLDPQPASPRKKGRWLLRGALFGGAAAVTLVGLAAAAAGGWYALAGWHQARVEQVLHDHTGGEVSVGQVRMGWSRIILRDVRVLGRDGEPVLHAPRITLHGKTSWFVLGLDELDDVKLHGLTVDLRQDSDGWVLPERTLAVLRGDSRGGATHNLDVELYDTRLTARTERGVLTARVDLVDFDEVELDAAGWHGDGLRIDGVHLDGSQPIGSLVGLELMNGEARVRGLELWLRSRRDGRLDLPPVLADGVPHYLGGELSDTGSSWFEAVFEALPVPVDSVRLESGQIHLVDTAHGVRDVTWTVDVAQGGAVRDGNNWRVTGQGAVADGRAILDGGVDTDGRFEARLDLRDVPLAHFAPYLDHELADRGVQLGEGQVEAVFMLEESGAALGWHGMVAMEDVALEAAGSNPPKGRAARLLLPRKQVDIEVQGLGVLSDPSYQPIEDVRIATLQALLEPAGRAAVRRRVFAPIQRASVSSSKPVVDLLDAETPDAGNLPSGPAVASEDAGLPEELVDLDGATGDGVPRSMAERWRVRSKANREKFKAWLKERAP